MNKMNEDEILKDIDNYITFANKSENFSDINEYLHCKELARRMKGLLDLYKQKKEKNKKLQIRCKELIEEKQELNTALLYDNINKDKIRNFIKEETKEGTYDFVTISAERLKELLEED